MKTATLTCAYTFGAEKLRSGTQVEYTKKLKCFTTIKVNDSLRQVYTADLKDFQNIKTKQS